MQLTGANLLGSTFSERGSRTVNGYDPTRGTELEPAFAEATEQEIDEAFRLAREAFVAEGAPPPEERARLLEGVAEGVEELGVELVERVHQETGLPEGRIRGERGRTVGQLRLFAEVVREGSWVEARIDTAVDGAPDVRRMRVPLGPVAVFGASNFPLAFSVAGGDTASALAAGSPVVYKAHPAHPGTSELVARTIAAAVKELGLHPGRFSMVHGARPEVGLTVARHPEAEAIGFTGSLRAGRAIFDAATSRPRPIPVYAEMGSVNPVFVLPDVLPERADEIADGLAESVTMGTGQFCTNPGLVFGLGTDGMETFTESVGRRLSEVPPAPMLYPGIRDGFEEGCHRLAEVDGVDVVRWRSPEAAPAGTAAAPVLFATDTDTFRAHEALMDEVFGPSTVLVRGSSAEDLKAAAETLRGDLTASLHGSEEDLLAHDDLVEVLERKVGRLIFNGFPTGVRVGHAMHHGGPYPATTDARTTSVGTAAIERFARPVCYQEFPDPALPPELRDENPRGVWRLLDGTWTRDAV